MCYYLIGDFMTDRIVLHIDVNNAFLSWTAVDMLKKGSKIDIRNRYAVIGGDETKRRGIVLAKSNLCKAKGVYTSQTLYSARRLCPYLDVYPPNHKLYKLYSNYLYTYLLQYTNVIERFSIDECFLEYTDIIEKYGDPIKFAYKVKNDIYNLYGFTVNVGVGNNKLCAKMASDFSKPNKVHTLFKDEIKTKMWPLDVSDLFMIGKKSSEKLKKLNINTIKDLALTDKDFLINNFKKMGIMMWEYANGIDNSLVEYTKENPKSISVSTVLPYDYKDIDKIYDVLKLLTIDVVNKLVKKKMFTNTIGVGIKYGNLNKVSKQKKIENSSSEFNFIYKTVINLFNETYDKETGIRSLSVSLNDLDIYKIRQLSIFDNNVVSKEDIDKNNLDKLIINMEIKYGKKVIDFGKNNLNSKK